MGSKEENHELTFSPPHATLSAVAAPHAQPYSGNKIVPATKRSSDTQEALRRTPNLEEVKTKHS